MNLLEPILLVDRTRCIGSGHRLTSIPAIPITTCQEFKLKTFNEPSQRWQELASCSNQPLDLFFRLVPSNINRAKSICRECPVVKECLQHAIDNGLSHGIYGGTLPTERTVSKPASNGDLRGEFVRLLDVQKEFDLWEHSTDGIRNTAAARKHRRTIMEKIDKEIDNAE